MTTDVAAICAGLTKAQRAALMTLPLPGWTPDRVFVGRGINRSYSSIWRKSSKHWDAMRRLEADGLVEQRTSRGEVLWRPTKPFGLSVRAALQQNDEGEGRDG
jgi:hypothetical protein